jgi:Zn-finger nucleic acid-binding protein
VTVAGANGASCPKCEGVWLGADGLATAIRHYAAAQGVTLKTIALLEGPSRPGELHCPECSSSLQLIALRGVEVETCPTCRGVFLQRVDIEAIAKRVMYSAATWVPAHQEFLRTLRLLREQKAQQRAEKERRRGVSPILEFD